MQFLAWAAKKCIQEQSHYTSLPEYCMNKSLNVTAIAQHEVIYVINDKLGKRNVTQCQPGCLI